jgi:hypothetical protein
MPLNFPNNPSAGMIYTYQGKQWIWNAATSSWTAVTNVYQHDTVAIALGGSSGPTVISELIIDNEGHVDDITTRELTANDIKAETHVSATAPSNPLNGKSWWDTVNKKLFVYDDTNNEWVQTGFDIDYLDAYVEENNPITSGTFTKINVDTKGLVTLGSTLEPTDIPSLDAAKTTSGVFDLARIPAISFMFTAEVPNTGWTGTAAPFSITIPTSPTGLLETDTPIIDITMSGTYATDKLRSEQWALIYRITTGNNSITLFANKVPSVAIPVQIKVVR